LIGGVTWLVPGVGIVLAGRATIGQLVYTCFGTADARLSRSVRGTSNCRIRRDSFFERYVQEPLIYSFIAGLFGHCEEQRGEAISI